MSAALISSTASHSHKRRRIAPSNGSTGSTSVSFIADDSTLFTPQKIVPRHDSCVSCHRYLSSSSSILVICARCCAATCTICSRTCTASIPTTPPTPALTWASSPSTPTYSPKRMALTDHAMNANTKPGVGVKRKKSRDESDENKSQGEPAISTQKGSAAGEERIGTGCGRTVCKRCCFEDLEHDATSCYDCFQH